MAGGGTLKSGGKMKELSKGIETDSKMQAPLETVK